MLDAERKVLRIVANYSAGRKRMPSLIELGREGYISWSPANPEWITLIQAWEREDPGSGWQVYGSR